MNEKPYLSLDEVADLLGVRYQFVYRLVRDGELPAVKLGRIYRVARDDLDAFLDSRRVKPGKEELACAACGQPKQGRESFPGRCEECGALLCTDCTHRLRLRRCREHQGGTPAPETGGRTK